MSQYMVLICGARVHHFGAEGVLGDKAAGERLAKALRVAMAQAEIETWPELGLESGVSPTTIDNWIYGVTTPRAHHLAKVAKRLYPYTSAGALERAYAGLPPEEPPLIDVLRELAPDLHELVVILRAQADQAVLEAVRVALEERRRGRSSWLGEPRDTPSGQTGDQE
jgi:transcriptional regulator with XRE-family HTH domain